MAEHPHPALEAQTTLKRHVWDLIRTHRIGLLMALLLMPLSAVMAMLLPYLTKVAIDELIVPAAQSGDVASIYDRLVRLALLAGGVVLGGYVADALYVSILQRTGQRMIARLREAVYQRTLRLPRTFFDTHPIGTVLTRVTSDIEALGEALATGALSMFMDGLKTVAYLAMMFLLDWRLTLVLLLTLPLLVLVVGFFQSRIRRAFFRARQALSEATGYLQECLNGIKTIQLYAAERVAMQRFKALNARFYRAQNHSNFYDALLFALVEGISTLTIAFMLWYSAGELLRGLLTLGVLVAFMEYIQRLFVPVREFSQQIAVLQRAAGALDHINELFHVSLDPKELASAATPGDGAATAAAGIAAVAAGTPGAPVSPLPAGGAPVAKEHIERIEFENVHFRYKPDGPEILKGVSFTLRRGQTLAIVGATGSGKSSIVRLLIRAYGGYQGSIRINGEELRGISAERLSRFISVVHQDVFLFGGSIGFNISMARAGLDEAAVRQAARYVNADGFIGALEGGYDFPVLQGGANLSAGQGQLIAFARAVAAQTDVIVLDEATSAVDSMTEHLIQAAVGKLYEDKTVIAIAHRLSTIRKADTIVVLDAGRIMETGNHEELLARKGYYAQLVAHTDATGLIPSTSP
ncbi:MAG: ABC transporter ATP-binding protein [Candidatus Lambdaproteobacteria bacterium]|nr:ABC transporter ATP-binding protein [Candidatus Lambdaproteobacteria bacterium]